MLIISEIVIPIQYIHAAVNEAWVKVYASIYISRKDINIVVKSIESHTKVNTFNSAYHVSIIYDPQRTSKQIKCKSDINLSAKIIIDYQY